MAEVAVEIVQLPVAGSDNFSYLVVCLRTGKALGLDPGVAPDGLLRIIRDRKLSLEILANSHGHHDHIAGNAEVIRATGARLAAHRSDVPAAELTLGEGSYLQVGETRISVLHTPGHTPGSLVFNPPGALLTGDTLFVTRCGRADFPGSEPEALHASLQRLAAFSPDTLVYPGHDYGPQPSSTIGYELEHNPYLQCPDLDSFLRLRMGA